MTTSFWYLDLLPVKGFPSWNISIPCRGCCLPLRETIKYNLKYCANESEGAERQQESKNTMN